MLNGFKDRFRLQEQPWSAAKGPIIHRLMPVVSVVAQVMDAQFQDPALPRALDNTFVERPYEHSREQSQDIDLHGTSAVAPNASDRLREGSIRPASPPSLLFRSFLDNF